MQCAAEHWCRLIRTFDRSNWLFIAGFCLLIGSLPFGRPIFDALRVSLAANTTLAVIVAGRLVLAVRAVAGRRFRCVAPVFWPPLMVQAYLDVALRPANGAVRPAVPLQDFDALATVAANAAPMPIVVMIVIMAAARFARASLCLRTISGCFLGRPIAFELCANCSENCDTPPTDRMPPHGKQELNRKSKV